MGTSFIVKRMRNLYICWMQFIDSDCEVYTYKTQSLERTLSVFFLLLHIENSRVVKILYWDGGCAFDSRKIVMNRAIEQYRIGWKKLYIEILIKVTEHFHINLYLLLLILYIILYRVLRPNQNCLAVCLLHFVACLFC